MNFDLSVLNETQLAPVKDTEGALLVTAGAGSGKTRLLTHRIAHLICNCDVMPYNILAITFTNKASREMKERLEQMLSGAQGLWVSTFHSMCVTILRKFIHNLDYTRSFSIYGEQEKERLIKKIIKDSENNYEDDIVKKAMYAISNAKNDGLSPDGYFMAHKGEMSVEDIADIYSMYEKEMKKCNALDFDDLLLKAYELLKTCEEAREFYQEKFRYIHIDEFQDTNTIQYNLVKILANKHKNIMVVGDEDQSIYGWRGANISNIYNFIQDFNAKKYKLEQNYRSSKKILALANKIIVNNDNRMEKTLWTENDDGLPIDTFIADSESRESENVVQKIINAVKFDGYNYSDFAVLMRINALTRSFEEKMMQYGVPYRIFGGFKFYDRKEIKDIMAYLRIAVNHQDTEAILRVINYPKRGIGNTSLVQLMRYSTIVNTPLYDIIVNCESNDDLPKALVKKISSFGTILKCIDEALKTNLNVSEMTSYIVRLLNLKEILSEDTEENINRKMNIKELIGSMEQFVKMNPEADTETYLQNISLYSDMDDESVQECVTIATVHGSKGLEYKYVFVVGLEDGIFPLSRSLELKSELEEERRLMYVAITRAEKKLSLSFSQTRFLYGERKRTVPSRFLKEMGYDVSAQIQSSQPSYQKKSYERNEDGYGGGYGGGSYGSNSYNNTNASSYQRTTTSSYSDLTPKVAATRQNQVDLSKYKVGTAVSHKKFGKGIIASVTGTDKNCYGEIVFDLAGKMNLSLNYAPLEVIEE